MTKNDLTAIVSLIAELQSRVDALNQMLLLVAHRTGIEPENFREDLRIIFANIHQFRLQTVEDLDPATAAKLDKRGDAMLVDPDLLKLFRQVDPGSGPDQE